MECGTTCGILSSRKRNKNKSIDEDDLFMEMFDCRGRSGLYREQKQFSFLQKKENDSLMKHEPLTLSPLQFPHENRLFRSLY